ncbi:MAG: hypothetical protein P1V81_12095 [Planctomycetota bacterium]|nr:hypothetical protein [Planctomycetota bacterium]
MGVTSRFIGTVVAAAALLIGPLVGDLAAGGCMGCAGLTNYAGTALASCHQSPLADWQISASVEIESGECNMIKDDLTVLCDANKNCETTVTYSWGKEMADGVKGIGYQQTKPSKQPATSIQFGEKPPWERGKGDSVTFGPDAGPAQECGRVYSYFIEANICGPLRASVWASCTACGQVVK